MTTAVEHAAVRRSGRTRARAPPAPAGGVALSHVSMYLARACVYVFGPAVASSSGGASRAPGTPSHHSVRERWTWRDERGALPLLTE
jgi:hypothetical protein